MEILWSYWYHGTHVSRLFQPAKQWRLKSSVQLMNWNVFKFHKKVILNTYTTMGARQSAIYNSDGEQTFDNHSKINFVSPVAEEKPTVCVDPLILEELRMGLRSSKPLPDLFPPPEPSLRSRGRHRNSIAVIRPRHVQTEQANVFSIRRTRRRGSLVSGIMILSALVLI